MPEQINTATENVLYNDILNFDINSNVLSEFKSSDILDSNLIHWDEIKKTLQSAPAVFERPFFQLHIKKKDSFTTLQKANTIRFFATAYLHTKDVRYFNEFLWFATDDESSKTLMEICIDAYYKNINAEKIHFIDPSQSADAQKLLLQNQSKPLNISPDHSKRICLVGNPVFFGKIYAELKKQGFHVEQFFIPYHPNKLINFVASNPILIKTASVLAGNKYKYQTLNFAPKDDRIKEILDKGNFDIGFHKLNFIIRKNIIDPFKIALLNDHWAMLPFLRGKSTIAWSVLLGFPLVSTLHFTETGIDSGPIAQFDLIDCNQTKKITDIRSFFRKTMPVRVINAINFVSSPQFCSIPNDAEKGYTYYEMHPWLVKHVEGNILPLKKL